MEATDGINFIYKYSSVTEEYTREPITKDERLDLIDKIYALPGEMKLDERIFILNKEGRKFKDTGLYCDKVPLTRDYINYWDTQKEMCYSGLLIDNRYYITGDAYFYFNFCVIAFKDGRTETPEIRDTDIWFFQLLQKAELTSKFTCTAKKRQFGFSLKLLSKILKRMWFEKKFAGKFIASDEKYINAGWEELESFRNHLNKNTAWKRGFQPDKRRDWMQRTQMEDKTYKGNMSTLRGITTKNNALAVVSGKTDEAFVDEAGENNLLLDTLGFLIPALVDGNLIFGNIHIGGAAGQLKNAQDLKKIIYNPSNYNMLELPNIWSNKPEEMVGIFVPTYYSYGNCKDEFGNSLVEQAKKEIEAQYEQEKQKSYKDYQIFRSQNPTTLEEMFAVREENIFPIEIIEPHFNYLDTEYKPTTIELTRSTTGITHSISNKYPIIEDFPVNKNTNKHGAICIVEPPMKDPPFGLYYAGVDTITPTKASSSVSLQSIHIYKASHEIDGEFTQEKCVAWYTGRPEDSYGAFEITLNLIEYYNARACIENDNRNFIEWMIRKKKTQYMMKRSQLPLGKDLVMKSNIDGSEYGFKTGSKGMGGHSSMKQYLMSLLVEYCTEEIGTQFMEDGTTKEIYGVTRIKDKMVLKEMLNWSPKKNTDRLFSIALAIFSSRSNSARGVIVKTNRKIQKKAVNYNRLLRNTSLIGKGLGKSKLGF